MKSVTIHKLDNETERALMARAAREETSLNRLVKRLLRESLGIGSENRSRRDDFATFCGRWTPEDARDFDRATAGFEEIDEEVWK